MEIYNACKEGNIVKFLYLIEQEKLSYIIDWGLVLDYSCKSGNLRLVEIVLNKYDFNIELLYNLWPYEEVFDHCVYNASFSGQIEIVKLLMSKGSIDLNENLYSACRGGHRDMIDFMINIGANNYTWAMHGALEKNHMDIVDYMISLGADIERAESKYKIKYLMYKVLKNKYKIYKDLDNVYTYYESLNDDLKFKICEFILNYLF